MTASKSFTQRRRAKRSKGVVNRHLVPALNKKRRKCVDCSEFRVVEHLENFKSSPPRCFGCGGMLI